MDLDKLKAELAEDEGRKSKPYKDTKGIWTGGIGHNLISHNCTIEQICNWLSTGIPDATIDNWFDMDCHAAIQCARSIFPCFDDLPDNVQRTLSNMAFDLMYELKEWGQLRAAVFKKDWPLAAKCIMASKFAEQAHNRCVRLAQRIVENGSGS